MSTRRSRRRRGSSAGDILKLISAVALIVIAVVLVIFVWSFIKSTDFLDGSRRTTAATETETSEPETEAELKPGFNVRSDGKIVYLKSGDADILKNVWLETDGSLYRFSEDGYLETSDFYLAGMHFVPASDGRIRSIAYEPAMFHDDASTMMDYPFLVKSKTVWAYLDESLSRGSFSSIMYKKTTESVSHRLGGTKDPQFTGRFSMQIDGDYIYWLPLTGTPESIDEKTNGRLYRMKPGAETRELVAEDVQGYLALGGAVYYCSGGTIRKTTEATEDKSRIVFDENGTYYVDASDPQRAVLMLEGGWPVTVDTGEFRVGDFLYELAEDGRILSVESRESARIGDYTYTVRSELSYGTYFSRVVREDRSGEREYISTEFSGTTGSLHAYNGTIYAEYTGRDDIPRILKITTEGDVDYLIDSGSGSGRLKLYGISGNDVVCLDTGNGSFVSLRPGASVPLAAGIDPVPETQPEPETEPEPEPETEPPTEPRTYGVSEYGPGVGNQTGREGNGPGIGIAPVPETTAQPVGPGYSFEGPGQSYGPGGSGQVGGGPS